MQHVILDVTLELEGPVLTHSSSPGAPGIDAPHARTHTEDFALPGTLVRGRLLDAWRDLESLQPNPLAFSKQVGEWLGLEAGNVEAPATSVDPNRGRLRFADFTTNARPASFRYRIAIDPDRGTAKHGAYQVIESPFAPGERVAYRGRVEFFARDPGEADEIRRQVETGLKWTPAFGAFCNIGFGRTLDVSIEARPRAITAPPHLTEAPKVEGPLDLVVTPRDSFCLARLQPDGNLFESDEVIPGSALKGCVARMWLEMLGKPASGSITRGVDPARPELANHFESVRFTHAFPSKRDTPVRPVRPPLSLVTAESAARVREERDVALCSRPVLLFRRAPAFAVDWKETARQAVRARYGWPTSLDRDLRVHTAIDRNTGRAETGKLFAYETIVPEGHCWLGRVDLSRIQDGTERARAAQQLGDILSHGLWGLGKTDASADVTLASPAQAAFSDAQQSDPAPITGVYVVTLQTDALLCAPASLDETSGEEELATAYAAAWADLSNDKLSLVRHFTEERLAGGHYLHRRFQAGTPYAPYLLTGAGSVFVLAPVAGFEAEARALLEGWRAGGLRLPTWADQLYARNGHPGAHWSNCPFIPENGFGEIAVNLPDHTERQPRFGEFEEIEEVTP